MEDKIQRRKKNTISLIIVIIILIIGALIISKYNFHEYVKAVRDKGETTFTRDNTVKYSKVKSYKIENKDYNDAMFSKTIEVKPNTPYKVTCMVKTENVRNENGIYTGGAQIAIKDTTECSKSITGTTDWTELTFMFNSKNRESVEIAFRLGSFEEKTRGTAWFSDFKIEEGTLDSDNKWNMACFIIENVDLHLDIKGEITNFKFNMTSDDIYDMETDMSRVPETLRVLSNNQMTADYDVIRIKEPLTKISYDEKNEYYVSPNDVEYLIEDYLEKEEYDYIYVAVRLGDLTKSEEVLVHDWIGLGGMDYYGIGFSNIRLPDSNNNYTYKYNTQVNTFPEEVFIHEFIHTLERNEKEYGNTNIADFHDYEKFGYGEEGTNRLEEWYGAYMQNKIKNPDGTSAGLTKAIYSSKPPQESNFRYSYELNELDEPGSLIEKISILINKMTALFKKK